eukprot:s3166_g2.t1
MDFLATALRGGLASLSGVKRVVKRSLLMNIYRLKEQFYGLYDSIVDVLDCERRRQLQWRRENCVPSFRHKDGLLDERSSDPPVIYDFTDLQHGDDAASTAEGPPSD